MPHSQASRGAGQPRKPADQAVSVRFSLALTPAEADEYRMRGATTWVRRMLQKSGSGEIVAICNDMLAECPPHKKYENYRDGWTDACNEIKWEIERMYGSPFEVLARSETKA